MNEPLDTVVSAENYPLGLVFPHPKMRGTTSYAPFRSKESRAPTAKKKDNNMSDELASKK